MTVRFLCQSTHLKVSYKEASDDEIAKSEEILVTTFRAEDSTLKRTWAVKKGFASAVRSFYIQDVDDPKQSKNLLPVGFLPWVEMYFEEANIDYEVIEMREWPKIDKQFVESLYNNKVVLESPSGEKIIPRDYQIEAVLKAVQARQGIIQSPVGSGKSLMLALLCRIYSDQKILCLMNSIDLTHQTYDNLIKYGFPKEEIGIIQGQNFQDDRRITIISVASYEKAAHLYPEIKVILVDESHELGSGTGEEMSTKILYSCQNAPVRIGLSATADAIDNPFRQMSEYGNLGPIVFDQHIQDKISEGSLSNVEIQMYTISGFSIPSVANWADSYKKTRITSKKQKQQAIDEDKEIIVEEGREYIRELIELGNESNLFVYNEIRNNKIVEIAKQYKHTLILYTRREHGIILYNKLKKIVGEQHIQRIDGLDKKEIRENAKEFLLADSKNIVLASGMWDKGVDIPWIHTLMVVGGGISSSRIIQKFGRSTRLYKGKDKAIVIDFMDRFNKIAARQSEKRFKIYEDKLRFKVEIK